MDSLEPDGSRGGRFDYVCDGVVVGTVILLKYNTTMQVWSLEITPEYRRLGHARGVMKQIYTVAASQECRSVWLRVDLDNAAAIKLYESEGFVVTEVRGHDCSMERVL